MRDRDSPSPSRATVTVTASAQPGTLTSNTAVPEAEPDVIVQSDSNFCQASFKRTVTHGPATPVGRNSLLVVLTARPGTRLARARASRCPRSDSESAKDVKAARRFADSELQRRAPFRAHCGGRALKTNNKYHHGYPRTWRRAHGQPSRGLSQRQVTAVLARESCHCRGSD